MAKVWKFGDDIDKEIVISTSYLNFGILETDTIEDIDKEDIDKIFANKTSRDDIIKTSEKKEYKFEPTSEFIQEFFGVGKFMKYNKKNTLRN